MKNLRMTRLGVVLVASLALIAMFGRLFAPYNFNSVKSNGEYMPVLDAPSVNHFFGTTSLGMDVFSRSIYGTQTALFTVFLCVLSSLIWGCLLSVASGLWPRFFDSALLMVTDILMSIPSLLTGIVLSIALSGGKASYLSAIVATIVAETFTYGSKYFRILRIEIAQVKLHRYVEAASVLGLGKIRTFTKHILPNSLGAVPVLVAQNAASSILTLAGLGFLGVGIQANTGAEWGYDLSKSLPDLQLGIWWTSLFPAIGISILVIGFGLISEGLAKRAQ